MSEKPKTRIAWSESSVYAALQRKFDAPAWVMLPQVRSATGFVRRPRTADAIAASVWPSRGLYFVGFEIKVSRSDWTRELKDVEKSCDIQQYCRHWYIAAPAGIVPVDELPPTWGLIECLDDKKVVTAKQAPVLEAADPDIDFVCSVLRTASEVSVPAFDVDRRIQEASMDGFKRGQESASVPAKVELDAIKNAVGNFERTSGLQISNRWTAGEIGDAVKFVMANKHLLTVDDRCGYIAKRFIDSAKKSADEARRFAEWIEQTVATLPGRKEEASEE